MEPSKAWLADRIFKKRGSKVRFGAASVVNGNYNIPIRGDHVELDLDDMSALAKRGLAIVVKNDPTTGFPGPVLLVPVPRPGAWYDWALAIAFGAVSATCAAAAMRPEAFGI